ncbi:group II intron maturase-specific domain-containing protein [Streptomyces sp. NPDC000609]|uniref:group II intron maturase-specific domain-containing protein n=1 Tax=Streptomyces sp. NPDC000609 TaxID=3160957 RepID=UPI0033945477
MSQEAWEEVRAIKGAPGVDGQSIEDFEKDLKNNLYKVWDRMSSGSYFPPPVRAVEIRKPHGSGTRMLGIPAVADRVAQAVVARHLMRRVDPIFHPDSYLSFQELARRVNPKVAGWINYYDRFGPWELNPFLMRINAYLVRWIRQKYKRLTAERKAIAKMQEIARRYSRMFAHWRCTIAAVMT